MKLLIPSLFIFLPVKESKDRQATVDEPNMAAMWHWLGLTVIADHAGQGFYRLEKAKIGTTAWVGCKKYRCTSTEIGWIQDKRLYRANGCYVHEAWQTGLCIYTCHGRKLGDIQPVRLTHWEEVNGR